MMPVLREELCDGCGKCVVACACGALSIENGRVVLAMAQSVECDYCADCEAVCESGAIQCPYEIVFAEDPRAAPS